MPASKKRYEVEILGSRYRIVSNRSEEYVKEVARLVEEFAKEVLNSNKRATLQEVAILAAMNFADAYLGEQRKRKEEREELYSRISGILDALDAFLKSRGLS